MWNSLIHIQMIIQGLRPLRVKFSVDKGFFENPEAKKKFKMRLIDCNLGLVVIASFIGLNQILSNPPNNQHDSNLTPDQLKSQVQKMVLGAVLFILFMVLFLVLLSASWSFRYHTNSAVAMMNQARNLYLERDKNPEGMAVLPSKKESALFGALLYTLLILCFIGLSAVTAFPITSSSNPGHVILSWILPQQLIDDHPFLLKLLASAYIAIGGYFGVIPVAQAFCFLTAVLYEIKYILKRGYGNMPCAASGFFGFANGPESFKKQWSVYSQAVLFLREINKFGHVFYPSIMLTGFCVNVVTTMVCIKFYHELPSIMLFLFLGFDAVAVIATFAIHSFAVVAKEESKGFREFWRTRARSKLHKKQLAACLPFTIHVGTFFPLQRSTLLNTVNEVVNGVVTLLLMDE